ncbi:MAG: YkgJ family cysteine cluster protein [Spirochaetes bacterium]|uniref:YkgJ family cysteine cluster protein n=1 Tax=Candidatus Ornithospirochaeta stercoripullorum TaxID=2840899 RepID=A0A9D9E0P0_9SPIO|nr:YkgJ family cysteine cluster protein [Candidatus Ornithospirochaeta stercoripullorum]
MFYDKGLRFECQMCSYCCSAEPGYVYLTEKDLDAASSEMGVDRDTFISLYCRLVDFGMYYLVSLRERSNYDCIFLTENGCAIYKARPAQCRTYPFWDNILSSEESWKREAESCPGIGKGAVISKREIEKRLEKGKEAPFIIMKK